MSNNSVLQSARDSFSFFCGLIGANLLTPMSFTHKFAIAMMEYMEYYINPKQQTNFLFTQHAPPRAGKSVLSTVFALSYLLGKESDKKMILMSASYYTLEQFLLQIKEIITHPVYKIIFPELTFKISESKGSMVIKTSNGGSLLFHSTLSKTPIGSGFHYIWLDDAMHYDAMFSEVQYRTIMRHIQNMLTRIQNDPRSKIFLNNQLLGANDISEVMKMNFRDLKIPFITLRFQDKFLQDTVYTLPNNKVLSFKQNEFLVPWYNERSQNEAYARIGNEESRILNEYKNIPTLGTDSIFDWKYVREYELAFKDDYVKKCHKFAIMTDFAFVPGEDNDFTVFTLVGADTENNLYLLDIQRSKYLTTTIAVDNLEVFYNNSLEYLKKVILKVHSLTIYIETTSLPIIYDVQNRKYPVQSLKRQGGMSKAERAKSVYVRFNSRKLHVPKDHHLYNAIKNEVISFTSTNKHRHDDICFIAGTKIATKRGNINIEDITINDYILTPFGFFKVLECGQTKEEYVIQRRNLIGTADHRIYTYNLDFKVLDVISDVDILSYNKLCDMIKIMLLKLLNSMELNIDEWVEAEGITCLNPKAMKGVGMPRACILQFMSFIADRKYQKASMFIIKIATHLIIVLKTWSVYRQKSITQDLKILIKKKMQNILITLDISLPYGTKAQKEGLGIAKTKKIGYCCEIKKIFAFIVKKLFYQKLLNKTQECIVAKVAEVKPDGRKGDIQDNKTKQKVYNIKVNKIPLYYANNVLVHNCDCLVDGLRYIF